MAALDRWYDDHGVDSDFLATPARTVYRRHAHRRRRRAGASTLTRLLLTLLLLGAILVWRLPGSPQWHELTRIIPGASSAAQVSEPPAPPPGEGGYAFLQTQPGSADPVTYDPCVVIHVGVNHEQAPAHAEEMVREAVQRVNQATGLPLVVDAAPSDQPLNTSWSTAGMTLDEATPPFVLVGWSTSGAMTELDGKVAGLGGSMATPSTRTGQLVWRIGQVALDADTYRDLASRGVDGRLEGRAIIMHELGHVVGLAHVDDTRQLMAARNTGRTEFGDGDLRGLYRLGQGACAVGSRQDPWDPGGR